MNLELPVASVLAGLSVEVIPNRLCTSPKMGHTLVNIWRAVLPAIVVTWVSPFKKNCCGRLDCRPSVCVVYMEEMYVKASLFVREYPIRCMVVSKVTSL